MFASEPFRRLPLRIKDAKVFHWKIGKMSSRNLIGNSVLSRCYVKNILIEILWKFYMLGIKIGTIVLHYWLFWLIIFRGENRLMFSISLYIRFRIPIIFLIIMNNHIFFINPFNFYIIPDRFHHCVGRCSRIFFFYRTAFNFCETNIRFFRRIYLIFIAELFLMWFRRIS